MFGLFKKNKEKTKSAREEMNEIVIGLYRSFHEKTGYPPSSSTTDKEIMTINGEVMLKFLEASESTGHKLKDEYLYMLVLTFLGVYEKFGYNEFSQVLEEELIYFRANGLKDKYKVDVFQMAEDSESGRNIKSYKHKSIDELTDEEFEAYMNDAIDDDEPSTLQILHRIENELMNKTTDELMQTLARRTQDGSFLLSEARSLINTVIQVSLMEEGVGVMPYETDLLSKVDQSVDRVYDKLITEL